MKIEVIPPVPVTETERRLQQEKYDRVLRGIVERDTQIQVTNIERGPPSLQTSTDRFLSELYVLRQGARAEEEKFDAVVVDCTFDPAVDALREMLTIPVVGPFQNAVSLAITLGPKFSILCLNEEHARVMTKRTYDLGIHTWKLASTQILGLEVGEAIERFKERVLTQGRKAVIGDGASVLILGCTTILGIDREISHDLGVPVIAPSILAIKTAETLAKLGLGHAKGAYPLPVGASRKLVNDPGF